MADLKEGLRDVLAQNSPVSSKGMSIVIRVILVGVVLIIFALALVGLGRNSVSETASFGNEEITLKKKCQDMYRAAKRCKDLSMGGGVWMCQHCPGQVDISVIDCEQVMEGNPDTIEYDPSCR